MPVKTLRVVALLSLVVFGGSATYAFAAQCEPSNGFPAFLTTFKADAKAQGISTRAVAVLDGLTLEPQIIALDRKQDHFKQSLEQFAGSRLTPQRISKGLLMIRQHAATLSLIERKIGVPSAIIVAIWGMETDFGANMGKQPSLRALASLAYDCRRSEMFQAELMDALRIIDRGDLKADEMRGAWAGEIGQTQFLPSSYMKYAVDFDEDGRRDLIHSVPDVLASTANYLKGYGWQRNQPWNEGSANFEVLKHWNKAEVYVKTLALYADKLQSGQVGKLGRN
jgi:lytic murein transglycosylase